MHRVNEPENLMFKHLKWLMTLCAVALTLTTDLRADEIPILVNFGLGGGWYEPATNGQGFAFDIVPESNQLVAYWYTYPEEGGGREWYYAQGEISGKSAQLVIYQTANGVFDQPSDVALDVVGVAGLTFDSCTSARFGYSFHSNGNSGEIALERIGTTRFCEQYRAGAHLDAVSASHAWVDLEGEWVFEGCVPLRGGDSHGDEWLTFSANTMTLEIETFSTPDCSGPAAVQILEMEIQRVDMTPALLGGKEVVANRYLLTDPESGQQIRQLWYVDDSGETPVISHGVLDSPPDDEGFPTELHELFFMRAPGM